RFVLEILRKLAVVVELAVERQPAAPVARRHRLRARCRIDHGEPRMTESDAVLDRRASPVRASVVQRADHSIEIGAIDTIRPEQSRYSAHSVRCSFYRGALGARRGTRSRRARLMPR